MAMSKKKLKKMKETMKRGLLGKRLTLPAHKVHKTKKDYKRVSKVKVQDVDKD